MENLETTFEKSKSIAKITEALSKFKASVKEIKPNRTVLVKTKTGGSYTFSYADLSHIRNIADPTLSENGIFVSQFLVGKGQLITLVSHSSGEYFQSTADFGAIQQTSKDGEYSNRAQEFGSLLTYIKRYTYCASLGISAEDDDDANSHDGNTVQKLAPNDAPWLNENEYQEAVVKIKAGEKGVMSEILETFKVNKKYREGLSEAEKNAPKTVEKPAPENKDETPKAKQSIGRNTALWTKAVIGIADHKDGVMVAIELLEGSYTLSEDDKNELVKEANMIIKGRSKVNDPTAEEKAAKMQKRQPVTA